MTVQKITFSGFRNLRDGVFEPFSAVNVLCGLNAQGKTNLIEALWLFTGSHSFRGAKDTELTRFGFPKGMLEMDFEAAGRNQNIRLTLDGGRKAELNGVFLESAIKLSGEFCAVVFSPDHLGLVKEGPSLRRRFLDAAICQIRPRHIEMILAYKKALLQRNALLKDIPYHSQLLDTLDVWDEKLVQTGARIVFTRLRYLKRLCKNACGIYAGIAKNGEDLALQYIDSDSYPYDFALDDAQAALREISSFIGEKMIKSRAQDIESGYTHFGPHRDDLQIFIGGISARSFGSQGQQRSAVLALKLAEAGILKETIGEPPVLLLDDVLSELDAERRDYLLNHIGGMQVFITCCEPELQGMWSGSVFDINAGSIRRRI